MSLVLENDAVVVEVDKGTGQIRRVGDRVSGTELVSEPRLADSFRILLPLPDFQGHYLYGTEQRLTRFEVTDGRLVLQWHGLRGHEGRMFDLVVELEIELDDACATFALRIENRTQSKLAEVWCPILGGITGFGDRLETRVMIPENGFLTYNEQLFQRFLGIEWHPNPRPEYFYGYPGDLPMPWLDLYGPSLGRGVYVGVHDPVARYKVLRLELFPGAAHGRVDPWPLPEELDGQPAGASLTWVFMPHTPSGETFEGPPVAVRFHDGDWHEGAAFYRSWFRSVAEPSTAESRWMRRENAFLFTTLMHPEGNIRYTYADIPRLAEESAAHGVNAILLYGWDLGGSESDYPAYEPDPRLGSWDELEQAIARCHELGVKVAFLVNLQPVDTLTEWYAEEGHRYASRGPDGFAWPLGYGFGTVSGRLDITRKPQVFASPAYPEYRRLIADRMLRLAEAGADGIHFDKLAWAIQRLAFNEDLPTSPDRAEWEGILAAMDDVLAACRAVNPDFCLSYEGAWDRLLPTTDAVWGWHCPWQIDLPSTQRFTFPEWLPCLAVFQPYDYNVVGNAIRLGHQLMVAPMRFTDSLGHPAMRKLGEYIRESLAVRAQLADTILLGEFLDDRGAEVKAQETLRYAVHRNPATGARACVVTNVGRDPITAHVTFTSPAATTATVHAPYTEPSTGPLPRTVELPPERFAVIVEDVAASRGSA